MADALLAAVKLASFDALSCFTDHAAFFPPIHWRGGELCASAQRCSLGLSTQVVPKRLHFGYARMGLLLDTGGGDSCGCNGSRVVSHSLGIPAASWRGMVSLLLGSYLDAARLGAAHVFSTLHFGSALCRNPSLGGPCGRTSTCKPGFALSQTTRSGF